MARRQTGNGNEVFRVVIEPKLSNAGQVEAFGPYATLGAAKGILTSAMSQSWRRGHTGRIQQATTAWEDVDA